MQDLKSPQAVHKQLLDPSFKYPIVLWKRCLKQGSTGIDELLEEFYRNHSLLTVFALRCLRRELRHLSAAEAAAWLLSPSKSLFLTYLSKQTKSESTKIFLRAVLRPTIAALVEGTGVSPAGQEAHVQLANLLLDLLRQLSYNTGVCPLKIREAFVILHRALAKRHKIIMNQLFCTAFAVFVVCPALADPSLVGFTGPISAAGRNNLQRLSLLLQFISSGSDSYVKMMSSQSDAFARMAPAFANSANYYFDQFVLYLTDSETLKVAQAANQANAVKARRGASEKATQNAALDKLVDFCNRSHISLLPSTPKRTRSSNSFSGGEESAASFTVSDSEQSADTNTPKWEQLSPEYQPSSRASSLIMKSSISSSGAGSSDESDSTDEQDPVAFLRTVSSSDQSVSRSGPVDVCMRRDDFAASYSGALAESSEVITAIELSESEIGGNRTDDSLAVHAGNTEIDLSEMSLQGYDSTTGVGRHTDIEWSDLESTASATAPAPPRALSTSRSTNLPVITELSFSNSGGSTEGGVEMTPADLSVALYSSAVVPHKSPSTYMPPSTFSAPKYANGTPIVTDPRGKLKRSKSDSNLGPKMVPIGQGADSDEESLTESGPRSKSTMFAPSARSRIGRLVDIRLSHKSPTKEGRSSSLEKPKKRSEAQASIPSTESSPNASPRSGSTESQKKTPKKGSSTKKRRASKTSADAKPDSQPTTTRRIPLLSVLRIHPALELDEDNESSGEITPQPEQTKKRTKHSLDRLKKSADTIDNLIEKITAQVAPGDESILQAKRMASELHRSHGDEIAAIVPELTDAANQSDPQIVTMATIPDELLQLKLIDAQDGVEKSIGELHKSSSKGPCVLVFLRQLGCMFGRRRISEIATLHPRLESSGTTLILISNGSTKHAKKILSEVGLKCPVLMDKAQRAYKLMHLPRGLRAALLNAKTMSKIGETVRMGFRQGRTSGDSLQLGGYFVFRRNKVLLSHPDKYTGDDVDSNTLEAICGCE